MLKRRASKRFVLAETGEPNAWDTTMDNDRAPVSASSESSSTPGYRRDSSIVDGVPPTTTPPTPPIVLLSSSSVSCTPTDSQGSSISASDVANHHQHHLHQLSSTNVVDGSRLAVSGTSSCQVHGASLK